MSKKSIRAPVPFAVRRALIELGVLLATARKEKRLSQSDLAGRVGVGRMTIARLERGALEAAMGHYLTAAWVLGLPVLSWSDFAKTRADTTMADILERYKRQLPSRIRKLKEDLKNDF